MDLSEIRSCVDVTDEHIARAMEPARSLSDPTPREKMLELVHHMSRVAMPGAGAARILILIAKMAPRDWMEGDVEVRLTEDSGLTSLTLLVDDGLTTERVAGPLRINAPLIEFVNAARGAPHALVPLRVQGAIEPRSMTLRRGSFSSLPKRAPSYSALAIDLMPGMARGMHVEPRPSDAPTAPDSAEPPTQRSPVQPASQPPRKK